jgi:hypothetical protein
MTEAEAAHRQWLTEVLRRIADMDARFAETDARVREDLQFAAAALERYRAAQGRPRRRRWFC